MDTPELEPPDSESDRAEAPAENVPFYRWPMVILRRLYDWTLSWAGTPYAVPALALLAFVEASFFPIPPDVLLMPMCLGNRKRSLLYAGVCTVGSVAGAALGYWIGLTLWSSLGLFEGCPEFGGGAWLFSYIPSFNCHNFEIVQRYYGDNAWLALFTAAFTIIPFKVFTVAAGVFHNEVSLTTLLLASAVGRGARFFLVAGLVRIFGEKMKKFIEKRFDILAIVFAVLLIGGFLLIRVIL